MLFIYAGAYGKFKIAAVDAAAGRPVDLTNCILTFTMRKHLEDATIEVMKATGGGITHRDQTTEPGVADLELLPADTVDLGPDLTLPTIAARLADELHIVDLWVEDPLHHVQAILGRQPFGVKASVRRPRP